MQPARTLILFFALLACTTVVPAATVDTEFFLTEPRAKAVFLAGEFNGWNTTAHPMQRDENGRWSVSVPLRPGRWQYKFIVDGQWRRDPENADTLPDGHGGQNSVATVTDAGADPAAAEKRELYAATRQAFGRSDFATLEKAAGELRRTKARFSDGLWRLPRFYAALKPDNDSGRKEDWQALLHKMDVWRRQFPDSITEPVVRATIWTSYAWNARGAGYGHTITVEGGRLFRERVEKAREVLDAAGEREDRCPHWAEAMFTVALGQGWPREDFFRLLDGAAEKEPSYYDYYSSAAYHLLPRWYGEPGEWEKSAEQWSRRFLPGEGLTIYTRAAWSMTNRYANLFRESAIEWPKMKQGFLDIEKQFPGSSWNLNAFCRFAVLAGDRATAHKLMQRIGPRGDERWNEFGRYAAARYWADPKTPTHHTKAKRVLDLGVSGDRSISDIAFAPDGRTLLSAHYNGQAVLWDTRTGEQLWSESPSDDPVLAVAFSPDGKLFAAAAGDRYNKDATGLVQIWSTTDRRQLALIDTFQSVIMSIAFTPDSKTLVLTGGSNDRKLGEAHLWNVASEKLEPLPWAEEHQHAIAAVTLSPDGRVLAADCQRSVTVWDTQDRKMLIRAADAQLPRITEAVAFSRDGKLLAVGGTPEYRDRGAVSGMVTLFDTATWKPVNVQLQGDFGGIHAVAFSPDGKLLAAAGRDGAVHLWDAVTGKRRALYFGHDSVIWDIAFSPDGKTLASCGHEGLIKLWEIR